MVDWYNFRERIMERTQLEQAIATLEAQRAILGDAVIDPALVGLRQQLAALAAQERQPEAQRKQVTVLFADVSGFTALSETLDHEDVAELMNTLWQVLDHEITTRGGIIDKHIGDAVMALWGARVTREDDPEQALRAALALQAALAGFRQQHGVALAMRIGVNTGPVLVGEVGTTAEFTAMGDAVNIASRLEHAAPIGGILIAHDTYRHVRGLFDVEALPPLQVKGKAEPLSVYRVERARPRAFRPATRGIEGVETPMIGRDAELQQLQAAYRAATDPTAPDRRVVTILGEAGLGKSRLLAEFFNWLDLQVEPIFYLQGRADPSTQAQPFALLRSVFSFRYEVQDSDPAQAVRRKLEQGIAAVLTGDPEALVKAHFIGHLLGFDFSASPHLQPALADPQQIHDRALLYLADYLRAVCRVEATVMLLEDLHWADDSSLDALDYVLRLVVGQPFLLLASTRPTLLERRPQWGGQPFHAHLRLQPLSPADSLRLVDELLQAVDDLPPALRSLIAGNAEGNPFYVEELIKVLIDDRVILRTADRWRVDTAKVASLHVPATLTGVLQARLDSLPPTERAALQAAAVVGRVFWEGALLTLERGDNSAGRDPGALRSALQALRGRELVFGRQESAFAGSQEYTFKHAMLRDVAYESVLKRVRRAYHRLVADWLIAECGERESEFLGPIAEHLAAAGDREGAADYLRRAGEGAAARYASAEAAGYFTRALDLTPETDLATRFALVAAREEAHNTLGAREAQRADLTLLTELAEALADNKCKAKAALRRATLEYNLGDSNASTVYARISLGYAEAAGDREMQAWALLRLGISLIEARSLDDARLVLEDALVAARQAGTSVAEAYSLSGLAAVLAEQGAIEVSHTYDRQALEIRYALGDLRLVSATLNDIGSQQQIEGDPASALQTLEEALRIACQIGFRIQEGWILDNLGASALALGDLHGAEAHLSEGRRIADETEARRLEFYLLLDTIETLHQLRQPVEAHREALRLQEAVQEASGLFRQAGAWAALGLALGDLGRADSSAEAYGRALAAWRERGDAIHELRALAGLAQAQASLGQTG